METVLKFIIAVMFYTGAAYIMNKYGLNVVDQPVDFIAVVVCFALARSVMDLR